MALLDNGRPPRDILPPINHPDFEKPRSEKSDHSRFTIMPGLSISTAALGSPNTLYSGPPPPYSSAPSASESGYVASGYFSPPQSVSRRSTRDEKDLLSAKTLPSLPSLHEALGGDKSAPFSAPPSATHSHAPGSTPTTAVGRNFPDAPRGPPNPFSHTVPPSFTPGTHLPESLNSQTAQNPAPEPIPPLLQPHSSPTQINVGASRSATGSFSSINRPLEHQNHHPTYPPDPGALNPSLRDLASHQPMTTSYPPPTAFNFEPAGKFDDSRNPFARATQQPPYGETVKRHLESFDAELALNEITEASQRTFDFSRSWSQRYHSSNRSSFFAESAPSVQDIDEVMRQQHRILENLNRIREVVIMQQTVMSEQRARAARGHTDDDYQGLHDEYKTGGFAGGDAKKRRGKAAPPGRCHSCNRAETPEWRRGPDGARTLCNACGLHYAKLTRKLGANKASTLAGSNLRPKGLDPRPPHI